jgi:hypothetical protein
MSPSTSFRAACTAFALVFLCASQAAGQLQSITVSVKDYGAVGDGVANDSAAIQAALNVARHVNMPPGTYYIGTTTLMMKRGQTLAGADYTSTVITYGGTGDAIQFSSGFINSSGYALVNIHDLQIYGSNALNQGAGIDLIAGGWAYFALERIRVSKNFKYGVIFDQAEISGLRESIIENGQAIADSANVWLTNGDEHTRGMFVGFTNVLQLENNQFNAANTGVMDDGGDNHTFQSNNFNGHSVPLRIAGASSLTVLGNTFETQLLTGEANVLVTTTSAISGGSVPDKGACSGGTIQSNTFAGSVWATGSSMLKFTAASPTQFHTGFSISANHFELKYGRGLAIDVTQLRGSFCGFNQDDANGRYFHYGGVHNDQNSNTLFAPAGVLSDPGGVLQQPGPNNQGTFDKGLTIGGGDAITRHLSATRAWDPGAIIPGYFATTNVAVPGARMGDTVNVGFSQNIGAGMVISASISAPNQATVIIASFQSQAYAPGAGTIRVDVWQH